MDKWAAITVMLLLAFLAIPLLVAAWLSSVGEYTAAAILVFCVVYIWRK